MLQPAPKWKGKITRSVTPMKGKLWKYTSNSNLSYSHIIFTFCKMRSVCRYFYIVTWRLWGQAQIQSRTLYRRQHWAFAIVSVCSIMPIKEHHFLKISQSIFSWSEHCWKNARVNCRLFSSVDKQTFCSLVLYCHTTLGTFTRIWSTEQGHSTLLPVRETMPY